MKIDEEKDIDLVKSKSLDAFVLNSYVEDISIMIASIANIALLFLLVLNLDKITFLLRISIMSSFLTIILVFLIFMVNKIYLSKVLKRDFRNSNSLDLLDTNKYILFSMSIISTFLYCLQIL